MGGHLGRIALVEAGLGHRRAQAGQFGLQGIDAGRQLLQFGAIGGLTLAACAVTPAFAGPGSNPAVTVTDLGPAVTACSAEPIAADMVCEPASMPPAAPGGRSNIFAPTITRVRPMMQETKARKVNLIPSPPRLFTKDGPTRSPTPYMNR